MIKRKDIRDLRVRYHRNGICGNSFFACSFTFEGRPMVATVFEASGDCAVLDPTDINSRWRGDHFEDILRDHINLALPESTL